MEAYGSFAEVYDMYMDNVPYDEWTQHLLHILRKNGIEDGLVADLGCGTGKVTRRMANAGYDMIGIDNSYEMLDIAMQRNTEGDILYLCQDMREFELYGTVKAVISVCDSMNYITTEEDLRRVFSLVNNYLDPSGIFIFDMNTKYKYEQLLADNVFAENRPLGSFIWENYYDTETQMNEYDLTLYIKEEEGYARYEETHFQKAYDLKQVKKLLEESGLEVLAICDVDTMSEPREDSERVYFVAREHSKKVSLRESIKEKMKM